MNQFTLAFRDVGELLNDHAHETEEFIEIMNVLAQNSYTIGQIYNSFSAIRFEDKQLQLEIGDWVNRVINKMNFDEEDSIVRATTEEMAATIVRNIELATNITREAISQLRADVPKIGKFIDYLYEPELVNHADNQAVFLNYIRYIADYASEELKNDHGFFNKLLAEEAFNFPNHARSPGSAKEIIEFMGNDLQPLFDKDMSIFQAKKACETIALHEKLYSTIKDPMAMRDEQFAVTRNAEKTKSNKLKI
ncbi:TPA: hypothetical protein QDB06_000762 [Burkholderia vietnamiensis]|nr:hypothetical protein [Burkholderia vietnamiensis]